MSHPKKAGIIFSGLVCAFLGATQGAQAISIPGYDLIETLSVNTTGPSTTTTSTTILALGNNYKIAASGTFGIGGYSADAEYIFNTSEVHDYCIFGGVAVCDYGIAINDTSVGGLKLPYWGPYNASHEYIIDYVGLGAVLSFSFHDDFYGDNDGPLTVQIFAPAATSETPLPGALPLFVGGLGLIGTLGWFRKRKAAVART